MKNVQQLKEIISLKINLKILGILILGIISIIIIFYLLSTLFGLTMRPDLSINECLRLSNKIVLSSGLFGLAFILMIILSSFFSGVFIRFMGLIIIRKLRM